MNHQPTQLASLDWPWKSEDPSIGIILVSDEQFTRLAEHPDQAVEKVHPQALAPVSLREHCWRGAERGATKLRIAYDYFFGGSQRSLYPDTAAFQDALKRVHDVAQEYGIGLEPSIISPLELGVGYRATTGEAGRWMHYREGLRDPQTGLYSVMMWQQTRWCNNKGPTPVKLVGARAFAFCEGRIPDTPFFAVDPEAITELAHPEIEVLPGTSVDAGELAGGEADPGAMFQSVRMRAHGRGGPTEGRLDRVLVVLLYETIEMDYLSPSAKSFLDDVVQQYHDRGISLCGLYSDEMHIQQDWSYHSHMDLGQFTVRYASPGLERAFAERFGAQYVDLAKYMVYFCCHQHDFAPTHEPKLPSQHVFGPTEQDVYATLRFRRDYYAFLERAVIELAVGAREKLERLNGRELDAFYHATWAESPTCDAWAVGGVHDSWSPEEHRRQYEYTPDFVWSNTIQQAAAACANYFSWNEFLTGGNDDTAEGGYADRNYYGRALACSLAALNRRPLASAGMWGMPMPVRERMMAINHVFGAGGHPAFRSVEDYAPRESEVLFLYPQDLVAVDERFGSWMVQYGYANYITADKLVEYGRVLDDGWLAVKGSRYRAVCALYEPFPDRGLLALVQAFARNGGTVIWSSTPPMNDLRAGLAADVFGVRFGRTPDPLGLALPARQIAFEGRLSSVPPQMALTDFCVDRVFPLEPLAGTERVATVLTGGPERAVCVGTHKAYPGGGQAVYLGFRPRDDQSASTGLEARTWFEILHALGAYPASGASADSDNPAVVSRTTEWLACAFPNGAIAVCPHYRHHAESWPGGFFRDQEHDQRIMQQNPPPDDTLDLSDLHLAGQSVTYSGRHAVTWRRNASARLVAFAGFECTGIQVDRTAYAWSEEPVDIAWHPLQPDHETEDYRPLYRVWCDTEGRVSVPLGLRDAQGIELWRGAHLPGRGRGRRASYGRVGYGDRQVPFRLGEGTLEITVDGETAGHWLYVVRRKP